MISKIAVVLFGTIVFVSAHYALGAFYKVENSLNETIDDANEVLKEYYRVMDYKSERLPKTVFHDRKRLIIFAGLEGAGHHSWQFAFDFCTKHSLCVAETEISRNMMHVERVSWILHGLFGFESARQHVEYLSTIYKRMKEIVNNESPAASNVHIIGLGLVEHSGLMSYPNFDVADKSLARPDVYTLAALAEAVGLDFRVVLLPRPSKTGTAALRERIFDQGIEPKVLVSSAEALFFQLNMLEKSFFYCISENQAKSSTLEEDKELINFISPYLTPIWSDMVGHRRTAESNRVSAATDEGVNFETDISEKFRDLNAEYHAKELEVRLKKINALC